MLFIDVKLIFMETVILRCKKICYFGIIFVHLFQETFKINYKIV